MASLADESLSCATIKTYLSAVRNMQISLGLPDPHDAASMPMLKQVQAGIQRLQAREGVVKKRVRLPLTTVILAKLRQHWDKLAGPEKYMLWAVASLCFFGFFRLGELLPGPQGGESRLLWGDVAVDSASAPSIIRVFLRFSKCDHADREGR